MDRRRIVIAAYACNPFRGSEEGVGWGWVKAIARHYDVWVITAEFHRKDIGKVISQSPEEYNNIHFHYVPHKPWHYSINSKGWLFIEGSILKPIMNYAYRWWQRDAYTLARELCSKIDFDLVHQLTYVGFRFPGHFWKLDVPFVWGPIGGIENTPWRFLPTMGLYGCIYYFGRNIINSAHRVFLRSPKKAFKKARGGIIAATEGIRREIQRWYGEDSEVICEIGPPPIIASGHSLRADSELLQLSWSGQHLPGKALPLLLKALTLLPSEVAWTLNILGTGPCSGQWRRLATDLKIDDRCCWHGLLPRGKAIDVMHRSHIFIITSLKDLTSTVLLEALSQGVPVICPDHCGFSTVVNDDCGIKVPVYSPRQLQADIASAIIKIGRDENERRRLAVGALERIKEFSWEKKALMIDSIYRRAIKHGNRI